MPEQVHDIARRSIRLREPRVSFSVFMLQSANMVQRQQERYSMLRFDMIGGWSSVPFNACVARFVRKKV